jgi:hypothetical protein
MYKFTTALVSLRKRVQFELFELLLINILMFILVLGKKVTAQQGRK